MFFHQASPWHFGTPCSQRCIIKLLNVLLSFLCYLVINWTHTFFMRIKYALIFLIKFRFFFFVSNAPLHRQNSFRFCEEQKRIRQRQLNDLKQTENQLKMNICSVTLIWITLMRVRLCLKDVKETFFLTFFLFFLLHSNVTL